MTPLLELDGTARHGAFSLQTAFTAGGGEVIALLGPNGAGKSTLLRALAGLGAFSGRLRIDGDEIGARPPHRRPVGWVPQDGALFPHLSLLDNVAFALGGRRHRAAAQAWLAELGVAALADRRPHQVSGGQAARAVLARTLARRPRLLLLDEPFAALDARARADVRHVLHEHLAAYDGLTILVTHDPVDAFSLAGRVLAVEDGAVVQDATVAQAARRPRTPWLAGLVGANALRGRVAATGVELDGGGHVVAVDPLGTLGADALAVFAATAVTLHAARPRGSARNTWPLTVRRLDDVGGRVRVVSDGPPPVVAEVTAAAVVDLGLRPGAAVWASVKATEVTVVEL